MTTFINLESYIECCQYSNLFGEDSRNFIPNQNALPLAYRDFCKRHLSESFLPFPAAISAQPQALTPRTHSLPHQSIGLSLNDQRSEYIFIVREANTLTLRSLQSRYLYANVYRYWSYAQQLEQFTTSSKPLVIYDLDSFTPSQITPLTFEHYSNAPHAIPLIDTRSIKYYESLKISQSYEKIYDTICLEISNKIILDLNLASDNLLMVTNYIKKINIFQNFNLISSDHIPLILEINQHFYLYRLAIVDFVRITYSNLPILDLHNVISENSDFNFVLLSSYTTHPLIRECVQQQFNNNLFMPSISNNFFNIWQQKNNKNFALYGQHLDRISFFVKSKSAGEDIKICLPERICYEGEQEVIVYGQYEKNGVLQESFPVKTKSVTLPFQINDESFLDGETGKEQIYQIENQFFDETPNIEIRIRFRIKPSLAPKLEVLDERQYILNSTLIDHEQKQVSVSERLGFIPMDQILKVRREKSIIGLQKLERDGFNHDFESFSKVLCGSNNPNYIDLLVGEINRFRIAWRERILPIFVIPDPSNQMSVLNSYKQFDGVLSNIFRRLPSNNKKPARNRESRNRAYSDLLLILGDSCALTYDINLDYLFNSDILSRARGEVISWDNQLRSAAKVSCTKHRQNLFLGLFENHTRRDNTSFYKSDEYIWGYARLLLWYVDINDTSLLKIYAHQYLILINHCLTLNANIPRAISYMRDALISLIYILTCREVDPLFVEKGSQAYNLSKLLCQKLRQTPILSRKANLDVPLNEFFDLLLDRTVTQEQVSNMIEID